MTAREGRREGAAGGGPAVGGTGPAGLAPLDQAFDADSLYALRAAVAAHAAAAGLGTSEVYDVTAVAHELAANAVVHGAGHGRLRLWADGGFLYCQVSDDGRDGPAETVSQPAPAPPVLAPPVLAPPASAPAASAPPASAPAGTPAPWPAEHGHGLWLVRQVAEHVGIGHGPAGTTATARFPLTPR